MYIPLGRKRYDRNATDIIGTVSNFGPPAVDNDHLCRQNYAVRDFTKTLRTSIVMNDLNSTDVTQEALKPAMKNSFFIKEQRWAGADSFIEPDDEQAIGSTADYL